jgi:hypothetical protein
MDNTNKILVAVVFLGVIFALFLVYSKYAEGKAERDRMALAQQNALLTANALANVETSDTGWLGGILGDVPIIGGLF